MAWTNPTTVNPGDAILASLWNAQVKDNLAEFNELFAADWVSWTPVIRQNGTRTSTTNYARYIQIGTLVIAHASVTITQAGSAGSLIECSLPVSAHATSEFHIGQAYYTRAAGTRYGGLVAVRYGSAANSIFQGYNVTNGFGADPNFATANNDGLSATFIYEAATPA